MITEERKKQIIQEMRRVDRILKRLKGQPPLPGEQDATDEEVKDSLAEIVETMPAKPKGTSARK